MMLSWVEELFQSKDDLKETPCNNTVSVVCVCYRKRVRLQESRVNLTMIMIIIEDDDGCFLTMKRRLDSKKESQHQVCYSLFLEASLTDHYES